MAADTTRESRSSDEIFPFLSEEFRRDVVTCALQHRAGARDVRRKLLESLRRLAVDGFRNPGKAPHRRLLRPVLDAIEGRDHRLARAVLDTWMESREGLRAAAAAHLGSRGIPVPETPDGHFESFWTIDEWRRERAAMTANDDALDGEAAGLMLCLVSRRFPEPPPLESSFFRDWLEQLRGLKPDAPDWGEADVFAKWVHHLRRTKYDDLFRWRQSEIEQVCEDVRTRFAEDLRYLDVDLPPGGIDGRPAAAGPVLQLVNTLQEQLQAYQSVRPQAASRDEERRRSVERQRCEEGILRLLGDWKAVTARPDPQDEPAPEAGGPGETGAVDDPARRRDDQQAGIDSLRAEHGRVRKEAAQLLDENGQLRDENGRLQDENRGLRSDRTQRDQEIDRLRNDLSRSRRTEEQWRRDYVDARRRSRTPEEDEPFTVDNVREAIDLAEKTFPDSLLIKLNSKSSRDTAFENPREVFDVLAWLATAYRNAPPEGLEEACPGWFYSANQSETTMGMFRDWYRTSVGGTTWELSRHVGKGTSHDPRRTIRIAFAWDESNSRVIVGFVGLHQKNRQS